MWSCFFGASGVEKIRDCAGETGKLEAHVHSKLAIFCEWASRILGQGCPVGMCRDFEERFGSSADLYDILVAQV